MTMTKLEKLGLSKNFVGISWPGLLQKSKFLKCCMIMKLKKNVNKCMIDFFIKFL